MLIGYDCIGLFYACILALSLIDEGLAKVLQAKWLISLGAISYCVYLIHAIVFGMVFAPLKNQRNGGAIAAILALVLTIVIAKLSWEYFEKPLVGFGHQERYEAPVSSGAPH